MAARNTKIENAQMLAAYQHHDCNKMSMVLHVTTKNNVEMC